MHTHTIKSLLIHPGSKCFYCCRKSYLFLAFLLTLFSRCGLQKHIFHLGGRNTTTTGWFGYRLLLKIIKYGNQVSPFSLIEKQYKQYTEKYSIMFNDAGYGTIHDHLVTLMKMLLENKISLFLKTAENIIEAI